LLGAIIPIIAFFPFFIIRMIGAGDIKLFSVIGCLMGWNFILNNIIYTFFIATIIAIVLIISRKDVLHRIKYLFSLLLNYVLSKNMLKYEKGEGGFPFAVAIFFGTVMQLIIKYNFI
jgi:prepilin peptidase CpaA